MYNQLKKKLNKNKNKNENLVKSRNFKSSSKS